MGRQSCSTQRLETSVDATVAFIIDVTQADSSELAKESEADMKKVSENHITDEKTKFRFTVHVKIYFMILATAVSLSLWVVGNQST